MMPLITLVLWYLNVYWALKKRLGRLVILLIHIAYFNHHGLRVIESQLT